MPEETVQSTSPLITKPEILTSEALRPASTDDIMAALDAASSPTARTASTTTRRRGRPPGSKNKTAAEKLAQIDPDAAKLAEDEAKRAAKKARAEEIQKQIYEELNDGIMTFVIGSFNIDPAWIYKPGKGPVIQQKDQRFTDLGERLSIPPNLAKSIGKLAAELENTEAGSKVAAVGQNSNVGLIVAGGMTLFGAFQYVKTLNDTFQKLAPLLEARKRAMQQQPEEQTISDSVIQNSGSVS